MSTEKATENPLLEGVNREGAALRSANQQQEPKLPRERPILFSAEMVRAILDGRKTQTRLVIRPQPMKTPGKNYEFEPSQPIEDIEGVWHFKSGDTYYEHNDVRCPFGRVGELLYVRESHAILDCRPDLVLHDQPHPPTDRWEASVYYPATDEEISGHLLPHLWREIYDTDHQIIRPSIHMPRWASRISLAITGIRVERIREISVVDVVAEGRKCEHGFDYCTRGCGDPVQRFSHFWNLLNEKRGYAWDANPWVWAIEFRSVVDRELAVD